MATFQERLSAAMGERGYEHSMRRSVQTVILYEAYRCLADRLMSLRPFQRKFAFYDQAMALAEASSLLPHQKEEVMWRTGTSKEPMQPDTAWKRMKLIDKEVRQIIEKIKPLCREGKSHEETYREFIQIQYVSSFSPQISLGKSMTNFITNIVIVFLNLSLDHLCLFDADDEPQEQVTGQRGKPCPPLWEHAHNNVIMTYQMYYRGTELDPTFPVPDPPKEIVVPAAKPKMGEDQSFFITMPSGENEDSGDPNINLGMPRQNRREPKIVDITTFEPAEDRRLLIQEIRDHLGLLKEFEGVIGEEVLKRRKRELFHALPTAPPSCVNRKKYRQHERELALEGPATHPGTEEDDNMATDMVKQLES